MFDWKPIIETAIYQQSIKPITDALSTPHRPKLDVKDAIQWLSEFGETGLISQLKQDMKSKAAVSSVITDAIQKCSIEPIISSPIALHHSKALYALLKLNEVDLAEQLLQYHYDALQVCQNAHTFTPAEARASCQLILNKTLLEAVKDENPDIAAYLLEYKGAEAQYFSRNTHIINIATRNFELFRLLQQFGLNFSPQQEHWDVRVGFIVRSNLKNGTDIPEHLLHTIPKKDLIKGTLRALGMDSKGEKIYSYNVLKQILDVAAQGEEFCHRNGNIFHTIITNRSIQIETIDQWMELFSLLNSKGANINMLQKHQSTGVISYTPLSMHLSNIFIPNKKPTKEDQAISIALLACGANSIIPSMNQLPLVTERENIIKHLELCTAMLERWAQSVQESQVNELSSTMHLSNI